MQGFLQSGQRKLSSGAGTGVFLLLADMTVPIFFSVVLSGDSAVRLKDGGESVPRRKAAWLISLKAPI